MFFSLVLPHINPFIFEEQPNRGETVQVMCYVGKGDMPVSFSWMLNGEPIPNYLNVNIETVGKKSSVLNIDSVEESHIGNYTCIASNRAGISTHSAELTVKGTK